MDSTKEFEAVRSIFGVSLTPTNESTNLPKNAWTNVVCNGQHQYILVKPSDGVVYRGTLPDGCFSKVTIEAAKNGFTFVPYCKAL